jgi:hypothetical protein
VQHAARAHLLYRAIATIAVAGILLGACRHEPSAELRAALERQVTDFFVGMASERPDDNRRAMAALMPAAEDFEALVPGHGAALWAVWGPEARRLVETASEPRDEYRAVLPVRGVRTADLRSDASVLLERSLDVLPADLPVFGVVIEVTPGERAASAFVPLRDRWVWIWNIERLAGVIGKKSGG